MQSRATGSVCCKPLPASRTANRRKPPAAQSGAGFRLIGRQAGFLARSALIPSLLGGARMPGSRISPRSPQRTAFRVCLNGALVPRAEAKVSDFRCRLRAGRRRLGGPAAAQGRPAVPGGPSRPALSRARAQIALDIGLTREDADRASCADAGGQRHGRTASHLRLMVTRGEEGAPTRTRATRWASPPS